MAALLRLLIASSFFAPAVCLAQWGWIQGIVPGSIRVIGAKGDVTFSPTNMPVRQGCDDNGFYIVKADRNAKAALALLLTASSTGKTVNIYVDPSDPCDVEFRRPKFSDLMLN